VRSLSLRGRREGRAEKASKARKAISAAPSRLALNYAPASLRGPAIASAVDGRLDHRDLYLVKAGPAGHSVFGPQYMANGRSRPVLAAQTAGWRAMVKPRPFSRTGKCHRGIIDTDRQPRIVSGFARQSGTSSAVENPHLRRLCIERGHSRR